MDVSALLRHKDRLVRKLAKEIMRLQKVNAGLGEVLQRRRQPALVVCEPTDVWVYCDAGVSLKAVYRPKTGDSDILERYLEHLAGKWHGPLLYHSKNRHGPFNGNGCKTVKELLDGKTRAALVSSLESVRAEREAWDKMMAKKGA